MTKQRRAAVQELRQLVARARWRRRFAFSFAFRLLARIAVLDLTGFFNFVSKLDTGPMGIGDRRRLPPHFCVSKKSGSG